MKKTIMMAAAALALCGMTACSGSNSGKSSDSDSTKTECCKAEKQEFAGILPAADADGVRYELKLDYTADSTCNAGRYSLDETYLTASSSDSSDKKFKSEGSFSIEKQYGKSYLKLVQDKKEDSASAEAPLYFLCDTDSTITMVNANLEVPQDSSLNYTLKLVK